MRKSRRTIIMLIFAFIISIGIVSPQIAEARIHNSPLSGNWESDREGGEYQFRENPDGTFTEWFKKVGQSDSEAKLGDTYTTAEMQESAREFAEIGIQVGNSGTPITDVTGYQTTDTPVVDGLIGEIAGIPYVDEGMMTYGDDIMAESISEGAFPAISTIATEVLPGVILGAGAAAIGVKIGEEISTLIGWPKLGLLSGGDEESAESYDGLYYPEWNAGWTKPQHIKLTTFSSCEHEWEGKKVTLSYEPICVYPEVEYHFHDEYEYPKGEKHESSGDECYLNGGGDYWASFPETCSTDLVPDECPRDSGSSWLECKVAISGTKAEGYTGVDFLFWSDLSGLYFDCVPGEGCAGGETGVITNPHKPLEKSSKITSPITPPVPAEVPPIPQHEEIHKGKRKEKEIAFPPIEEGEEIPSPSEPTVPEIHPNEPYTDYSERVKEAGLEPHERVLPEIDIDPKTGPGDVSKTSPEPGTSEKAGSEVQVEVNPEDAPTPETHTPIGGPTEPGFNLPNFGVLCKGFPFGVPCWLSETVEGMAATAAPPTWTIVPEIKILSHTVGPGVFHFSTIEPIMEIVRPVMVAFSIIGIVLLFYRLAKGGSPEGGSGSGGGDGFGSEGEANIYGDKEVDGDGYWTGWH
jgi:hypothetical protein